MYNLDFSQSGFNFCPVFKLIARSFCLGAYYLVFRWLPDSTVPGGAVWQQLRYIVCYPLFLSCGKNVNVERGAYIGSGATISVGSNSGIGINAWVARGTIIGSNVMMGPDVIIFSRNHRISRTDLPMAEQGYDEDKPVRIGDDVWIGARVIILPGITVGSASVIGAGAVVTKDVPGGVIVAGNPARIVRNRFSNHALE